MNSYNLDSSMAIFPRISIFLFLFFVVLPFSQSFDANEGPYKELMSYGFPLGLLPTGVSSYTINRTSGRFSLNLGQSCRVTLPPDNYLATYSPTITGKIVENRIAEIEGISVKAFFKWWGITGIRSSDQDLVFEVGVVTAKYPSKNFDRSPDCEGRRSASS